MALFCSNSLSAQACDPGEAGVGGVAPCFPCAQGRYQNQTGQDTCLPCEPGTFQDQTGQISCVLCEPGTFTSNLESISCAACPAGMTSVAGAEFCTVIPVSSSGGGGCGAITNLAQKSKQRPDLLVIFAAFFIFAIALKSSLQNIRARLALRNIKRYF